MPHQVSNFDDTENFHYGTRYFQECSKSFPLVTYENVYNVWLVIPIPPWRLQLQTMVNQKLFYQTTSPVGIAELTP
jgi:hypothetical protein